MPLDGAAISDDTCTLCLIPVPRGGRGNAPLEGAAISADACILCLIPVPGGGRGNFILFCAEGAGLDVELAMGESSTLGLVGAAAFAVELIPLAIGAGMLVPNDCIVCCPALAEVDVALFVLMAAVLFATVPETAVGIGDDVESPFAVTRALRCCISVTAEAACMLRRQLLPLIWAATSEALSQLLSNTPTGPLNRVTDASCRCLLPGRIDAFLLISNIQHQQALVQILASKFCAALGNKQSNSVC